MIIMHSFFLCQTSIGQNILPPLPVICGEGAMSLIMVFYGRLSRYHLMRAAIGVAHDDGTALFASYTSAVQIIVAYYAGCFSSCGHKVKLRWWRFFFSAVPVLVIVYTTMVRPASSSGNPWRSHQQKGM